MQARGKVHSRFAVVDAEGGAEKSFERDKASSEGVVASSSTSTPLEADFAALRKLREDDASGALKEFFGDGEDPREWSLTARNVSR